MRALEYELADHAPSAQRISEILKQHRALQQELQRLQALHADSAERVTSIQTTHLLTYPPL